MAQYEEQFCDAVEILINKAMSEAGYDRTYQAVIKDNTQASIGLYKVKYQDAIFDATSINNITYKKDDLVYILVPKDDWANDKKILGYVNTSSSSSANITGDFWINKVERKSDNKYYIQATDGNNYVDSVWSVAEDSSGNVIWKCNSGEVLEMIGFSNDLSSSSSNDLSNSDYILPVATSSTLGGVKIDGSTIVIDSNGVISLKSNITIKDNSEGGIDINVNGTIKTVAAESEMASKQDKLTAGDNIIISDDNVISSTSGTQPIELTKAEYDALGDAVKTDGKLYFIKDWTQPYAMNGKGMVSDILWEGEVHTSGDVIHLSKPITNYDLICIHGCLADFIYSIPSLWQDTIYLTTYVNQNYRCYISFTVTDDSTFTLSTTDFNGFSGSLRGITKVTGLRFCAATCCYSTDEQIVGQWIDGKPIYQKTTTVTTIARQNNFDETQLMSLNYETVIDVKIIGINSDGAIIPGSYYSSDDDSCRWYIASNASSDKFVIVCGRLSGFGKKTITIQYTKSTD